MTDDTQAGPGHNTVEIGFDDLMELLAEVAGNKKAVDEATGRLRSKVKEIVSDQNWNKGAFGDIRKIHNMSETSRADYLRTFKALFDVMWEETWGPEAEDLLSGAEDDGGAEQDAAA